MKACFCLRVKNAFMLIVMQFKISIVRHKATVMKNSHSCKLLSHNRINNIERNKVVVTRNKDANVNIWSCNSKTFNHSCRKVATTRNKDAIVKY